MSESDEDSFVAGSFDNDDDVEYPATIAENISSSEDQLTSIYKAIRRSILRLKRDSSHNKDEESDGEDQKIIIPDSDDEIDLDESVVMSKSRRRHVTQLESSDDESDVCSITEVDSSKESSNDESDVRSVIEVESSKDSTSDKNKEISNESIDLDSSNGSQNVSENSLQTSLVMSLAKQESRNSKLNPESAQQKAYLMHKQKKIENQLAQSKMLYNMGNCNVLPDKGEKLRLRIIMDEQELETIVEDLKKLQSDEDGGKLQKVEDNRNELFKTGSLDINPAYLKPTTSTHDDDLGKKARETFQREQVLTVERLKDLHGSLLGKPRDDEKSKDPRGLKVPLMPHQQYALTWLLWRERQNPPGGVLADDMGLGKTLTMISLIMLCKELKESGENSDDDEDWVPSARDQKHLGGTLIVAPASLVAQWDSEVKNRCRRGLLTTELYHGNNRETNVKRLARNDIVITTYNLISRAFKDNGIFYKIQWRRIILDEAHVIRNHKSQTCASVCGLSALKRWVLTGTPVQNKEMDLFAILKFLRCSPFDDVRIWKRWVDNTNAAGHERLATVMKSIMLRRTKQELQANGSVDSLPDKSIECINVELDREERLIYDKVMVYSRTLFAQFLAQRAEKQHMFELGAGKYDKPAWTATHKDTQFTKAQKKLLSMHADVQSHEILVLLLRLRQVCCHPSLINAMLDEEDIEHNDLENNNDPGKLIEKMNDMSLFEDEIDDDEEIGVDQRIAEDLLTSKNPVFDLKRRSSKMRTVLDKVEEIVKMGDKVIVVSQWVSVLEIVATELSSIHGVGYRRFTGKVPVKDRQGIMDDFNSPRSRTNVLLLSLTAGGVGLNLVGANHLLLLDIHWNPQLECQAQDRIYRFGQKKNVFIYKYICTDTIEERIKALQENKMAIANNLLSGGGKVASSKLTLDEMKSLFGL